VAERLKEYFAGEAAPDWSDVPTPAGPDFHHRCWDACRRIAHGEVRSYGELAEMAGSTRLASRAAGQAMRSNPLSVIVPCHRVVASDGRLHGYAGTTNGQSNALGIKRGLLELEHAIAPLNSR
jgi:methylated-DNA-[protein]-cysteine S-methyltransferase